MSNQFPTDNTPLFQNMDEQEQAYAPQQLPGAGGIPGEEIDQGGSAGAAAAGAIAATNAGLIGNPGGVTSASGPGVSGVGAVAPVVPVRPDASVNQPIATPISSADDENAGAATGSGRI